jgi:DNA-binding NarL/FixJ family response regulator
VLVVDDPRVSAALRHLLDSTADLLVVAEAATMARAEAAAADLHPDVAVVEATFPQPAAGLALIGQLARRMPVIALSSSAAARQPALTAGASCFLAKDGDADILLAALRAAHLRLPPVTS